MGNTLDPRSRLHPTELQIRQFRTYCSSVGLRSPENSRATQASTPIRLILVVLHGPLERRNKRMRVGTRKCNCVGVLATGAYLSSNAARGPRVGINFAIVASGKPGITVRGRGRNAITEDVRPVAIADVLIPSAPTLIHTSFNALKVVANAT